MRRDVTEQGAEDRLQQPGDLLCGAASARNDGADLQLVRLDHVVEGCHRRRVLLDTKLFSQLQRTPLSRQTVFQAPLNEFTFVGLGGHAWIGL